MKKLKEEFFETMSTMNQGLEGKIAEIVMAFEDWFVETEMNFTPEEMGYDSLKEVVAAAKEELLSFISNRIDEEINTDFDWEAVEAGIEHAGPVAPEKDEYTFDTDIERGNDMAALKNRF